MPPSTFEPRRVCDGCRRPVPMCWCRFVTPIPTRTRIVFLQHPRERDVAIGTARMAMRCLPNSSLHVGARWQDAAELRAALNDPSHPAILLYPGPGARDVTRDPPPGPVTLVVVDGTWSQANTMVRDNPELGALPRYGFVPTAPSEYRIRREPKHTYVSTIEAVAHVLGALEGDAERFESLLRPFRAMVDMQIEHGEARRAPRAKRGSLGRRRPPVLPEPLRKRPTDLLCVLGEANAWPHRSPLRAPGSVGELVHWLALRPATGETFEAVVAPRTQLAPRVCEHLALPKPILTAGMSLAEFRDRWHGFLRPEDAMCHWGSHSAKLLRSAGAMLPATTVDVRQAAAVFDQARAGGLECYFARLGLPEVAPIGRGRGGRRLAMLAAVLRRMINAASLAVVGSVFLLGVIGCASTRNVDLFAAQRTELAPARVRVPIRLEQGVPFVQVLIGDGPATDGLSILSFEFTEHRIPRAAVRMGFEELDVILDTGSTSCLSLHPSHVSSLTFATPPRLISQTYALSGMVPHREGRLEGTIMFGGYELKRPLVGVATGSSRIGGKCLRSFRVTFDQATQRVRLARDEKGPIELESVRGSGFGVKRQAGLWVVNYVLDGSTAAAAGVRVGDVVETINGRSTNNLSREVFDRRQREANEAQLGIDRGGRKLTLRVPVVALIP